MDLKNVALLRLQNQQINASAFKSVKEGVAFMSALQAQDFNMAKWAVGLRVPGIRDAMVEDAMARGEIIRTHVLRPTWHFVSADDVRWMLSLTAPRIKALMATNNRKLGLDENVFKKSRRIIEKLYADAGYFTRDEIKEVLTAGGVDVFENRLSHILIDAELEQLLCSGPVQDRKQTYAWMDAHVPAGKSRTKEEALAELTRRYLNSHGPATLYDFSWWSGLSLTEVRIGWELVKADFTTEKIEGRDFHFNGNKVPDTGVTSGKENIHFLPAFDEFLVSYADRSASLHFRHTPKTITKNGMFFPTIVVNGQVIGLWKKKMERGAAEIEPAYFYKKDALGKRVLKEASKRYAEFLGAEIGNRK